MLLIFLLLRLTCLADSIFPAVGTLFRPDGTAEKKMALIAYKNHFNHQGTIIPAFPLIINHNFPQ